MAADRALGPSVIDSLRQLTPPGEPDVLVEILELFLTEVPKKLRAAQEAFAAGDAALVARTAHSLKGSSGNIGANALFDVCRRIDDLAKNGDLARVAPLMTALTDEYQRVETEVRQLLQTS